MTHYLDTFEVKTNKYMLLRFLLGMYLFINYVLVFPYATQLFSSEGFLKKEYFSIFKNYFPNLLLNFDSPFIVQVICFLGVLFSFLFSIGIVPRLSCFVLWYLQTILVGRNYLTLDPSTQYIGLLLILLCFVTKTPDLVTFYKNNPLKNNSTLRMPNSVWYTLMIVFSISIAVGGVVKLQSESWLNGSAMTYILDLPIAENNYFTIWVKSNPYLLFALNYLALAAQITTPLFSLFKKTHYSLILHVLEFLFIFLTLKLDAVAIGMMIYVCFLFLKFNHKQHKSVIL